MNRYFYFALIFFCSCTQNFDAQVVYDETKIQEFNDNFLVRYINLDRSPRKNALIQEQFKREHVNAIRFAAIDGGA